MQKHLSQTESLNPPGLGIRNEPIFEQVQRGWDIECLLLTIFRGALFLSVLLTGCSAGTQEDGLSTEVPKFMEVTSMSKFDQKLKAQIEAANATSHQTEIPVILHFKKGADFKKLEKLGFKLNRIISLESGLASGTIIPYPVQGMEDEETVEFLEPDQEATILPAQ